MVTRENLPRASPQEKEGKALIFATESKVAGKKREGGKKGPDIARPRKGKKGGGGNAKIINAGPPRKKFKRLEILSKRERGGKPQRYRRRAGWSNERASLAVERRQKGE